MSSHAEKKRRDHRHRKSSGAPQTAARPATAGDFGPYVAFLLIWAFATGIFYLVWIDYWLVSSVALVAAMFLYVTALTIRAYLGHRLFRWQAGLVRLPLLMVGAGASPILQVKGTRSALAATFVAMIFAGIACAAMLWIVQRR